MPKIGDTIRAKERWPDKSYRWLGSASDKYRWDACPRCGKERWVKSSKTLLCHSCAHKVCDGRMSQSREWQGGRIKHSTGYMGVRVARDDFFYPMTGKDGYILEHRLVMAKYMGRNLHSWEIVHHVNGKRTDNRLSNLRLIMADTHNAITILTRKVKVMEIRITALEAENALLRSQWNVPTNI